jgi:hypothetical protein
MTQVTDHPVLAAMVRDLKAALGTRLRSVVLYGSAARGDFHEKTSDFNLLLVLEDLGPSTLEALAGPLRGWRKGGQPMPRLFSPALVGRSVDVFPIEFLDIRAAHLSLHGDNPFAGLAVGREHLRLQCERELKERMMRLREGYAEAEGRPRDVRRLIAASYASFAALFRGALYLLGIDPPAANDAVVRAFCDRAGLQAAPFEAAARLRRGDDSVAEADPKIIFARYYEQLERAVEFVDRLPQGGGDIR